MITAETPFEFFTVSYLTRIGNQSAGTLTEFLKGLGQCSDASIFHHTFQTLSSHHFLTEGFSNDFAQWAHADASREDLAEQLAALDVRDYLSIAALRSDLCRVVSDYCTANPALSEQAALERFTFARAWRSRCRSGSQRGRSKNFATASCIRAMLLSTSTSSRRGCACNCKRTTFRTGWRTASGWERWQTA